MKIARTLTASLAALVVLLAPLVAVAADVRDGSIPANGLPMSGQLGGSWNGSAHKVLRSDADGALKILNDKPAGLQTTSQVLYGSTITASSTINVSPSAFSNAAHYGKKYLRIVQTGYTTGAAGVNGGCVYRILGSHDGVTYYPIYYRTLATADSIGTIGRLDTLQIKLWTNDASPNANGFLYPLTDPNTGGNLPFEYIRVGVLNRGSATVTATLEVLAVPESN